MYTHTHPHGRSKYQLRLSAQRNLTLLHYKHHRLDILEVLHEGVQYKWKGATSRITSALFDPLPRANKVCQQFTRQLRSGTHNTSSRRDCCTPAHTKLRHRQQGDRVPSSTTLPPKSTNMHRKKPSASRKKDVSICKARIKKPPTTAYYKVSASSFSTATLPKSREIQQRTLLHARLHTRPTTLGGLLWE